MTKKKVEETDPQQSQRFRDDVRRMIDAGELNPTEADKALDQMVRIQRPSSRKEP